MLIDNSGKGFRALTCTKTNTYIRTCKMGVTFACEIRQYDVGSQRIIKVFTEDGAGALASVFMQAKRWAKENIPGFGL